MSSTEDNDNNYFRSMHTKKKVKSKILNLSIASGVTVFLMAILIAGMDVSAMQVYAQTVLPGGADQSGSSMMPSSDQATQNLAMASSISSNDNMTQIFGRNITGTTPVGASLAAFLSDNVNISLADGIGFAKQSLGDNQSITLRASFTPVQGFWVYRFVMLGSDGMVHFVLVDPANGKILDSHSFTLQQAMALRLITINRMREDQGRLPLNLARIIFLSRLAENQTTSPSLSSTTSGDNVSGSMVKGQTTTSSVSGGIDVDRIITFSRDLNGSLPVGVGLNRYINGIRNATLFGDAISTAQQSAGGNGSFVLGARLTMANGFWVYRITTLGRDGMIHISLIDLGNGKILATHSFTIQQWIALRALTVKMQANDDTNGLLKRPGLAAIIIHMRGNNPE